ncbi:MAG: hypothetical protein KDK12_14455, partial [Rhodobacteraceae bacterium]|nr:hypothetical protein [Paracoccaceae bacterium]
MMGRRALDLSVVVPVHDDAAGLERLIASLAPLGLVRELIVVDDASEVPIQAAALPPLPGACVRVMRIEP